MASRTNVDANMARNMNVGVRITKIFCKFEDKNKCEHKWCNKYKCDWVHNCSTYVKRPKRSWCPVCRVLVWPTCPGHACTGDVEIAGTLQSACSCVSFASQSPMKISAIYQSSIFSSMLHFVFLLGCGVLVRTSESCSARSKVLQCRSTCRSTCDWQDVRRWCHAQFQEMWKFAL